MTKSDILHKMRGKSINRFTGAAAVTNLSLYESTEKAYTIISAGACSYILRIFGNERGDRMRLQKVNEHEIRCVLNNQDLEAHQITMKQLRYGTKETQDLFREIVSRAIAEYNFNAEGLPLMIEAIPMSPEELLLIISAVEDADELDPHFAEFAETELDADPAKNESRFLETENVEEIAPKVLVLHFKDIDEVVRFCRQVPLFEGRSLLYRCPEGGFYMSLTRPDGMSARDFSKFINSSSEFGTVIAESGILYARLMEHEEPVMKDPLIKLVNIRP